MGRLLCLVALLSACVWAGSLGDAAGWIGSLRGVRPTGIQERDGQYQAAYMVTDGPGTMDAVRAGLMKRGWMVDTSGTASAEGAAVQGFRARKDSLRMEVVLSDAVAMSILTVRLQQGAAPGQQVSLPSTATTAPVNPGGPGVPATSSGAATVIEDSHVSRDVQCQGTSLTLNGSHCTIRVLGHCSRLSVNASFCTVSVTGKVDRIDVAGSHNTVNWSAGANPQPPPVDDVGSFNQINRM